MAVYERIYTVKESEKNHFSSKIGPEHNNNKATVIRCQMAIVLLAFTVLLLVIDDGTCIPETPHALSIKVFTFAVNRNPAS